MRRLCARRQRGMRVVLGWGVFNHARPIGPAASIFVVEDDFAIRQVLCEILTNEGYRVIDSANGADALNRLRASGADHEADAPKVVLLDLRMPVMDGYEFLKRRDADLALKGIPVIILSADDVVAAAELRSMHPEIHSLRKPINLELLFDLIRREIVAQKQHSVRLKQHPAAGPGIQ